MSRKHILAWIGIVATIALTVIVMVGASATGLAKTPEGGTLEAEEGGGPDTTTSVSGPISATVDVTLSEWTITPSVSSAKAGNIIFNVENTGPSESHELIILKTDLDADSLPTEKNKSLDESGDGVTSPGETHELDVGDNQTVTVAMDPGNYIFVDNIVEKGLVHWEKKPYATFTVQP